MVNDDSEEEIKAMGFSQRDHDFRKKFVRLGSIGKFNCKPIPLGKYCTVYKGLINDPEFERYVGQRLIFTYEVIQEFNPIRSNNEQILSLIEAELIN